MTGATAPTGDIPGDLTDGPGRWRAFVLAVLALGLLARANALDVGYIADDYMQLAMLEGLYPAQRSVFDLYHFIAPAPDEFAAHLARGTLPWWTWGELHGGVFRPLASATLALDHALFGLDARWAHLHSLFWWVAMTLAAARLLRRTCPPRVASLALLLFALDASVSLNVGWIANRCALLAATFAFLALERHRSARLAGARSGAWLGPACFTAALASGEYALVLLPYLAAWEWWAGPAPRRWRALLRACLPYLAISASFILVYELGGYGTHGAEEVYAHPLDAPTRYLDHAFHRIPRTLGELFVGLPAATGEVDHRPLVAWFGVEGVESIGRALGWPETHELLRRRQWHAFGATCALLLLVTVAVLLRRAAAALRTSSTAREPRAPEIDTTRRWYFVGAVAGLLPVIVAPAHGRLLTLSALGASVALACVMLDALTLARTAGAEGRARALGAITLTVLAWLHAVADPLSSRDALARLREDHARVDAGILGVEERGAEVSGREVVLLSATDQSTSIHAGLVLAMFSGSPGPRSWHTLSMSERRLLVERPTRDSLVLSPLSGPWLDSPPERFFRPERIPLRQGSRVQLVEGRLELEVLRTDPQGRPIAIRLHAPGGFERPDLVFLVNERGLRPFVLPSVGERRVVAPPSRPRPQDRSSSPGE